MRLIGSQNVGIEFVAVCGCAGSRGGLGSDRHLHGRGQQLSSWCKRHFRCLRQLWDGLLYSDDLAMADVQCFTFSDLMVYAVHGSIGQTSNAAAVATGLLLLILLAIGSP